MDEQTAQLETEAEENHVFTTLGGENAVDLSSPGVCTGWSSRTGNGAVVGGLRIAAARRRPGLGMVTAYTASGNTNQPSTPGTTCSRLPIASMGPAAGAVGAELSF